MFCIVDTIEGLDEKSFQELLITQYWSTGMSESTNIEVFLSQAEEREKEYDWLFAAEFYGKALNLVPETDSSKRGEVQERVGYALYRAAMQAENPEEFREWYEQLKHIRKLKAFMKG